MKAQFTIIALLLSPLTSPLAAHAQSGGSYDLSWSALGGGGTSSGGFYSLCSTIGQPDAGTVSGGNYTMDGGFWSFAAPVNEAGRPLLTITRAGTNLVVSWPSPSTGFVLEESPMLGAINWTPVTNTVSDNGSTRSVTVKASMASRFYRLRK